MVGLFFVWGYFGMDRFEPANIGGQAAGSGRFFETLECPINLCKALCYYQYRPCAP